MPIHNSDVAERFNLLADLLEIQGANPFRVRAYRNAARIVQSWPASLSEIVRSGEEMPKMPGIGRDLAGKIQELVSTGKLEALENAQAKVPRGLVDLLKIPNLGPKRVKILEKKLKIRDIGALEKAARSGKIHELDGFGEKIEKKILEDIRRFQNQPKRMKLAVADAVARSLLDFVGRIPGVDRATVAGSYRRQLETVGDLDLLVTCKRAESVMDAVLKYEDVERTLARGKTKLTVLLRSGIQVDVRAIADESYGAALHYFTGSKAHNILVRGLGVRAGLKINEYGVFRGSRRIAGKTEEEVFRSVGLPWIEPELREDRGEIEAARAGKLPKLVTTDRIRGDLHAHTDATDGRRTLEQMAEAARARGYEYLAISDHSRHLSVASGLDPKRLKQQGRKIEVLNSKWRGFRLLKSIEVDILEDGKLDLPDESLNELDLVVGSIHYKFDLGRQKQTERILRAMKNPYFQILGHPTGRLIDERPAYDVDIEKIIRAAADLGCFLELNAQPDRMDLTETYSRMAKDCGARVSIATDAHNENDLGFMRFGVAQARRGWLEAKDVANTLPWAELSKLLRKNKYL